MQSSILMKALKEQLHSKQKTYADVAKNLKLSESSVKRLMQTGNLSIARLEKICEIAGIELTDLFHIMQKHIKYVSQLSERQEKEIVSDIKLLLITICALNHWSLDDILHYYNLTKAECIQKLLVLNELKIIELLPNNKIKLLIASDFSWITNGPIQRFFQEHLEGDFFESKFDKDNERFICLNGMLSAEDNANLQKRIKQLAEVFSEMNMKSAKIPIAKLTGSALIIGLRPWVPKLFDKFKKT